ncbi:G protein coupled receptor family protein [Decorospora gaudefroyi]|uniref:G protein coupled receptor family protein n=1 Tax=Decorospora gaudefroyi TaxID=184978 RepID=A0A6A5KUW6_9PLEO|nr:G protein coupled receptor family protein [Decorospora gaudefroyi]
MAAPLSPGKRLALEVATRLSSVLSVIGAAIIISTFVCFPFFRKPINRIVFFATWGNLLANVATLISTAVLPEASQPPSGLCEFQGTLIQWFMQADAFWVLCMATNVFLVFFNGYDAQQLRHLEKWYFVFSYGLPGIPSIVYVILGRTGHQIMGSATLWCWVKADVDWMRIAFFYGPVWVVIAATISIYTVTGYRIWKRRAELRTMAKHRASTMRSLYATRDNTPIPFTSMNNIVVTTQIKCDVQREDTISRTASPEPDHDSTSSFSSTHVLSKANKATDAAKRPAPAVAATRIPGVQPNDTEAQRTPDQHNTGAASRNGYQATIIATNTPTDFPDTPTALSYTRPTPRRTAEGHAASMAYLQVAFLMFLALFVVWLPSSINRMHQFVHHGHPSYPLNLISALVLPLQGAWNATIYIFTTRAECRRAWRILVAKLKGEPAPSLPRHNEYRKETMTSSRDTRESGEGIDMQDMLQQGGPVRSEYAERGSR